MKVTRKNAPGRLWDWLGGQLPGSLVQHTVSVGYGVSLGIYRKGHSPGLLERLFQNLGDPVAIVGENVVELFHPEYFSDIEDLLMKYERESGSTVELVYWESLIRKDGLCG